MKIGDLVRYRQSEFVSPQLRSADVGLVIQQGRYRQHEFRVQWLKKVTLWERETDLELVKDEDR